MQVVKNLILKEVPGKYPSVPVDIFTYASCIIMSPGTAPILKSEDGFSHGIITWETRYAFGILVEKPLEIHLL